MFQTNDLFTRWYIIHNNFIKWIQRKYPGFNITFCPFIISLLTITEYCTDQTISLTDTSTIVNLTSPFYPAYYPPKVDCTWHVRKGGDTGFIIVYFDTVSLFHEKDYLTVGIGDVAVDSVVIFRLSGTGAPRMASINESSMWFRLTTDNIGEYEYGFNVQVQWQEFAGKLWRFISALMEVYALMTALIICESRRYSNKNSGVVKFQ